MALVGSVGNDEGGRPFWTTALMVRAEDARGYPVRRLESLRISGTT